LKIGHVGAIAGAVGFVIGLASAPATAAPTQSGARLFVYTDSATSDKTRVTVEGAFPMSEADTVGYLNNIYTGKQPGGMEYLYYGDDNGQGDRTVTQRWVAGNGSFDGYSLTAVPERTSRCRFLATP
jgi:hypothetical protein